MRRPRHRRKRRTCLNKPKARMKEPYVVWSVPIPNTRVLSLTELTLIRLQASPEQIDQVQAFLKDYKGGDMENWELPDENDWVVARRVSLADPEDFPDYGNPDLEWDELDQVKGIKLYIGDMRHAVQVSLHKACICVMH